MLDERRIRLMTKLALYENNNGKEDFEICSYYQNDYVSKNCLWSFLWGTIGYICLVALIGLSFYDVFLHNPSMGLLITIGIGCVVLYLSFIALYVIYTYVTCRGCYKKASGRMKTYYRGLTQLLKMYEKEKK